MPLVVVGIDEAGLGPLLGPLCVGLSAFRVEDWAVGEPRPDLWKLLSRGVCKEPRDAAGRIAVADSKALKLANSSAKRHPLTHLERGVLAFAAGLTDAEIDSDAALFSLLGATLDDQPWYRDGERISLPLAGGAALHAIAANLVSGAMSDAGVRLLAMRCRVVAEREFNAIVDRTGNKADVSLIALGEHLSTALALAHENPDAAIRVVCDKLGGRDSYAPVLQKMLPGWRCHIVEQGAARSRYDLIPPRPELLPSGVLRVSFQPEAEDAHLPVALASMVAKIVRELAMHRFNQYWTGKMPELKPTAGYRLDARRWLGDAGKVLTRQHRDAMIRRA
jgi:hypothetical protein